MNPRDVVLHLLQTQGTVHERRERSNVHSNESSTTSPFANSTDIQLIGGHNEPSVKVGDIVEAIKREPSVLVKDEARLDLPVTTYGNVDVDMSRNKGDYLVMQRSEDCDKFAQVAQSHHSEMDSEDHEVSTKTKASRSKRTSKVGSQKRPYPATDRTKLKEIVESNADDYSNTSELHDALEEARTKVYLAHNAILRTRRTINKAIEEVEQNEKELRNSAKQFISVARMLKHYEDEEIREIENLGSGSNTNIIDGLSTDVSGKQDIGIELDEAINMQNYPKVGDEASLEDLVTPLKNTRHGVVLIGKLPGDNAYAVALRNIGIKMVSKRYIYPRKRPSEDREKAFMADLVAVNNQFGRQTRMHTLLGTPVNLMNLFQHVLSVGGFKAVIAIRGIAYITKQLRSELTSGRITRGSQIKKIYLDELYIYERLFVHGKPPSNNELNALSRSDLLLRYSE